MHMIKTHKNLLVILSLDRNVTSWSNPGIICGCKYMSKPQEQPDLISSIRSSSVHFTIFILQHLFFFAFSIAFQTFLDFHSNFFFYKCSWNSFSNLPSNPNYSGMKSLQSTEMSLCTQHLRPKRPFSCERYYVLIRLLWDFPKSSFSQNFS